MKRIVGIDNGHRRIGVSLSDEEGMIAQPLTTIEGGREGEILQRLEKALQSVKPDLFVVGLPLRLDGSEGGSARSARRLARAIEAHFQTPTELWDERMTSLQAEKVLIEAGLRRDRRRAATDKVAATILLQSFLDANRNKWLDEEPV